jgi:DNA-binding NarL/FixJ family response regulator
MGITEAEWRTINHLQDFKTTKDIGGIEHCTESAVQSRLGNIYMRLKVPDRPSLMYKLGQHELVWKAKSA